MSKHTPGPWAVKSMQAFKKSFQVTVGVDVAPLADSTDRAFAILEANARLMSAAPELLNALHMALNMTLCSGSCLSAVGGACDCWRGHAHTTITKATGDARGTREGAP